MLRITRELVLRLNQAVRNAQQAGELPAFDIPTLKVTRAARPEHGDYATSAAMQLAGLAHMKPDQLALILAGRIPPADFLAAVEPIGGFVNFRLADRWLQAQVDTILEQGRQFAQTDDFAGKRAQVECVSANPTGPITVGRVRGGVMGDTLARLLASMGYRVEKEYYYNNAGAQMDKLAKSVRANYLEQLGLPFQFPDGGYEGDYIAEIARDLVAEIGDSLAGSDDLAAFKEFAGRQISAIQKSALERINIVFDNYFSEQSLYVDDSVWNVLERLEKQGLVYRAIEPEHDPQETSAKLDPGEQQQGADKGPAVWLRMRELRGTASDKALVKSSGEPTYRLPDIAYHVNKLERGFDLAVNILGTDHIEEFKDVKACVAALGYDAERIQVVLHQFVTLTEGGETRRMSTRKGEYVTLDELIDDVGPDAVRYFMLARSPDSHMDFDLELARQQSNENPVYYIQNAYVRCAGIARMAEERGATMQGGDVSLLTDPRELGLIRKLLELPEVIEQCAAELAPHKLAFWAHEELARLFHTTYEEIRALHDSVPPPLAKARLKLYAAARVVLAQTLDLMGMSAPEHM